MSQKAIVMRSGGLGDFVLALPLLAALQQRGREVILMTKAAYCRLIRLDKLADACFDLESAAFSSLFGEPSADLARLIDGADVYSFLPDADGVLARALVNCGAATVCLLPTRPSAPPHFCEQMFAAAELPLPASWASEALLARDRLASAELLWLHPGSGSPRKNAPLSWFAARADAHRRAGGRVIVSLGEAELAGEPRLRAGFPGCEFLCNASLEQLRSGLSKAGRYLGNDSGVSHLAAAIGVPVQVCFICTDPEIWRPLGPQVEVVRQ